MSFQFAFETPQDSSPARIKVVGVGGAGGNAVNRMIQAGLSGVEFISVNTDLQVLESNLANVKIQIGSRSTRGLGAGANPEMGRQAIEESHEEVAERLKGADMVFITAGMGGGTGTGAAPVVAEIARELGILTIAIVTRPFDWEGKIRRRNARTGLEALRQCVDTMIVIPNQKLLAVAGKNTTVQETFRLADDVLYNATRGISEMILRPGIINVDFADVSAIMRDSGQALMGSGSAAGENRSRIAAEMALHSQLLDSVDIRGATGMLVNFTGRDIRMSEVDEVMGYFREALGETDEDDGEDNTIFGVVEDPDSPDEFRVTLIATGFDPNMDHLPSTGAQPVYQAPVATNWAPEPPQRMRAPAPQPVQGWQPVAPTQRNAPWQSEPAPAPRAGTGSIPAATTRAGVRTREPSGVAPLAPRSRSEFVPDYQEIDDTDTPAFLRMGGR